MRELLTITKNNNMYNMLTKDLDRCLKFKVRSNINMNYMYYVENGQYAIRYPGATRGCVATDANGIITKACIYHDSYETDKIYKDNVDEVLNKYIGAKIIEMSHG